MRRNSSSPASSNSSDECILKKLDHEKGGFDILRRFRITAVQTAECPKPARARANTRIKALHQIGAQEERFQTGIGR
jgi:hypothetical protein